MNDNNVLKNQILNILNKGISDGEIKVISQKDIKLITQIASNFQLSNNSTSSEMIFVAAPTGAGKDTLVRKITSHNPEKQYVVLNMDMFRHYYSSIDSSKEISDNNFAENTNQVSYEIYYLMEELILNYYNTTNVILTGTIKDTPWIENILKKYKKHNYSVSLSALAVPYSESAVSIYERYLNMVQTQLDSNSEDDSPIRFTGLKYHDETFNAFSESLKHFENSLNNEPGVLLDNISVFKRDKSIHDLSEDTLLYSSSIPSSTTATNVVTSILNAEHTIDPKRFSNLLDITKKYIDYLKSENVYTEIIESLKKIYSLNKKENKSVDIEEILFD